MTKKNSKSSKKKLALQLKRHLAALKAWETRRAIARQRNKHTKG